MISKGLYGIVASYSFWVGESVPFLRFFGGRERKNLFARRPKPCAAFAVPALSYFPRLLPIRHIGRFGRDLGISAETPLGPCN